MEDIEVKVAKYLRKLILKKEPRSHKNNRIYKKWRYLSALRRLVKFGIVAVPTIIKHIRKDNPRAWIALSYVLMDNSPLLPIDDIVAGIRNGSVEARRHLLGSIPEWIEQIDPDLFNKLLLPLMIEALRNPDKIVRYNTLSSLGYVGKLSSPALPSLFPFLHDADWKMRNHAARMLAAIDPQAANDPLTALLGDDHEKVRSQAEKILEHIRLDGCYDLWRH